MSRTWVSAFWFILLVQSHLLFTDSHAQKKEKTKIDVLNSKYEIGDLIYSNPLRSKKDVENFILEGKAEITFANGRLNLNNKLDASLGQEANYVFWCDVNFPDSILISFQFYPIYEPGLCVFFFSAKGINGEDIFDNELNKREGEYRQYHHGDINTLYFSYFRRRKPETKALAKCNLRKSFGHHIVAQGADPIPSVEESIAPYLIQVVKYGEFVELFIDGLLILSWADDGETYGEILSSGKIGFRQMSPTEAEYTNLRVERIIKK